MDLIFESSAVAACLFAAGTLNLYIGVSHSQIALSQFLYNKLVFICISKLNPY